MRICFIGHGQFTHIGTYLDYFKNAGHDVHFVCLAPGPERGLPTYNVGFGKKYSASKGKWKYPLSMLRAKRLLRRLKPEIVHTHYATSGGLTGLVCGFHPTVLTVHGSDLMVGIKSRIWRPLLKVIFKHTDCINTVSKDLRDMVLSLGISPDKIEILTPGIDTKRFSFVERPIINPSRVLRLVCTRRLESTFDHHTIIEALLLLRKKGGKFQMTLVGDGSLLKELKQQVKDAGLVNSVNFMGRVDNNNLPEILHKHDVYLSASLWDGTSLCLLEAMATGIFPIVSNIRANSAWIEDGVGGFLHEVGDPEGIVDCIMRYVRNPKMAKQAADLNRKRVMELGDRKTNMRCLEKTYIQLVEENN